MFLTADCVELNMSDELANQKRDQQRAVNLPVLLHEQDSKASIQFLNGLVDGLVDDDLYPAENVHRQRGATWRRRVSMEALLEMRKWLQHFDLHGAGQGMRLHIERAPGFRLVEVLKFFCRRKTWELLIEPMHTDFLLEYYSALEAGQRCKACYLQAQMHVCLVYAVASERVLQALGTIFVSPFKARPDK
jgi:hypothetical protein